MLLKDLGAEENQPKSLPKIWGGTNEIIRIIHGNLEDTAHRKDNVKTIWPREFALLPAGITDMPKVLCFGPSPQRDPFPQQDIYTLISMLSWLLSPGCLYDTQIPCLLMPGLPKGVPIPFATFSRCPVLTPLLLCTSGHGCW